MSAAGLMIRPGGGRLIRPGGGALVFRTGNERCCCVEDDDRKCCQEDGNIQAVLLVLEGIDWGGCCPESGGGGPNVRLRGPRDFSLVVRRSSEWSLCYFWDNWIKGPQASADHFYYLKCKEYLFTETNDRWFSYVDMREGETVYVGARVRGGSCFFWQGRDVLRGLCRAKTIPNNIEFEPGCPHGGQCTLIPLY